MLLSRWRTPRVQSHGGPALLESRECHVCSQKPSVTSMMRTCKAHVWERTCIASRGSQCQGMGWWYPGLYVAIQQSSGGAVQGDAQATPIGGCPAIAVALPDN